MKRYSYIWALFLTLVVLFTGTAVWGQSGDPVVAKATQFITSLQKGDYKAAYSEVDSDLGFRINAQKLGAVWKHLIDKAGPLVKIKKSEVKRKNGYFIVTELVQFKKGHVDVMIALDNMLKVADFRYQNHKAAVQSKTTTPPPSTKTPADNKLTTSTSKAPDTAATGTPQASSPAT